MTILGKPLEGGSAGCLLAIAAMLPAQAMELTPAGSEWSAVLSNTLKYSAAYRVEDPSQALVQDINLDDGSRNFDSGLISNRLDLLSEFDVRYGDVGLRLSGAAWYDAVYDGSTDNDSPATYNARSVDHTRFTDATQDIHRSKAELLDAFVLLRGDIGTFDATLRIGQHTVIYGESLFFGANGVSNAQGPVDMVKLFSVPNSEFKEILRPVPQASVSLRLSRQLSLSGYYQFGWEETRLPAVGSYFSFADFVGDGTERLFFGGPPGSGPNGTTPAAFRIRDLESSDSGQGGLALRFTPAGSRYDFGFYAATYHERIPQLYLRPSGGPPNAEGRIGDWQFVYPQDAKVVGLSATTTFGLLNLASEVSYRFDAPLNSDPQIIPPGTVADNDNNPAYAIGDSFHAQLSAVSFGGKTLLWDGFTAFAEIAYHERISISDNPQAVAKTTTRSASALRVLFTPNWFQVLPGLDLTAPIGVGYNLHGRSSVIPLFNGGTEQGGDFSVGIDGIYDQRWTVSLRYTDFFGTEGAFLEPTNALQMGQSPNLSFDQALRDRGFVSLSVQYSF